MLVDAASTARRIRSQCYEKIGTTTRHPVGLASADEFAPGLCSKAEWLRSTKKIMQLCHQLLSLFYVLSSGVNNFLSHQQLFKFPHPTPRMLITTLFVLTSILENALDSSSVFSNSLMVTRLPSKKWQLFSKDKPVPPHPSGFWDSGPRCSMLHGGKQTEHWPNYHLINTLNQTSLSAPKPGCFQIFHQLLYLFISLVLRYPSSQAPHT